MGFVENNDGKLENKGKDQLSKYFCIAENRPKTIYDVYCDCQNNHSPNNNDFLCPTDENPPQRRLDGVDFKILPK